MHRFLYLPVFLALLFSSEDHSLHTGWYWRKSKDGEKRVLRIDGHYASRAGKYLLGCVWFERLLGESVLENEFIPKEIDPDHARFLRVTADQAVAAQATSSVKAGSGQ